MLQKLLMVAGWAFLAFIAYATLSPIQDRPTLPTGPGFEHVAAFAVLGVLFSIAYPRQTSFVCLLVFGGAVFLELAQMLTPDRHGRIFDAIRKIIGGGIGISIGQAALYFAPRSWFHN